MIGRAFLAAMLAARLILAQEDPNAVLARARVKVAGITGRLLKYTCLETIERMYYAMPVEKTSHKLMTVAPSCENKQLGKNGRLWITAKDRLRLEVAVAGGDGIHEINSWAAASRFDSRSIFEMVVTGPISSGAFGTSLIDVFENPGVRFSLIDGKGEGPRRIFEYAFEVPAQASHYAIKVGNEWKDAPYHGLIQINAATADLMMLIEETDKIPPGGETCAARTSIAYHLVPIGDGQFLVPRQVELETLSPDASETASVTNYSACHEYAAESTVRFDDGDAASATKTAPAAPIALPPDVSLTLALLHPIDTDTAAAGDEVSAKVVKEVRTKDSKTILVPAGAVAHGRILQMRHQYASTQFQISIRFDTLEINEIGRAHV